MVLTFNSLKKRSNKKEEVMLTNKKVQYFWVILLGVAVMILLIHQGKAVAQRTPAKDGKILRIGELAGLTGGIAPYGIQLHNARLLAIEEINNKGGVVVGNVPYKIELVHLDAGGAPAEAIKVLERLITIEKLKFILDGASSSAEYALAPILKTKEVIMIWSGGNDPDTTVGIPNAFRNHFDGGKPFVKVNELFLNKMKVKKISTYGQTGHSDFKRLVEEYLPKVAGFQVLSTDWYAYGEKDYFPILTKIKTLKPDAVLAHGFFTDAVTMLKQAREIGLFPGVLWLNQYAAAPLMMDKPSRQVFEGTYEILVSSFAATSDPPAKSKKFFNAYGKKFGETGFGGWAEAGYDSVYILAKALEKAGTVDGLPKIIGALHDLTAEEIPELLQPYKPGKIFDAEGQAYPKIVAVEWKEEKQVPVFSDYGR
jgi:branched-chain amino acid transport system substrate-binding protein